MRSEIKKNLLEIFTLPKPIDIELKTSILNEKTVLLTAIEYELYSLELKIYKNHDRSYMYPFLHGLLSAYRSVGGKGSEQLLNMLYPRSEQYLFPLEQEKQEQEQQKKQGVLSRLFKR